MAKGVRDPGLRIVLLLPQNPTDKGVPLSSDKRAFALQTIFSELRLKLALPIAYTPNARQRLHRRMR
jgi:hypothetical protein